MRELLEACGLCFNMIGNRFSKEGMTILPYSKLWISWIAEMIGGGGGPIGVGF